MSPKLFLHQKLTHGCDHLARGMNLLFKIWEIIDLRPFDGLMNILARASQSWQLCSPSETADPTTEHPGCPLQPPQPPHPIPPLPRHPQVPIQVPIPVQLYMFIPVQLTPPLPMPAPNLIDEDIGPSEGHMPVQPSALTPPWPPNPKLLRLHTAVHTKFSSEVTSLRHMLSLNAECLCAHQWTSLWVSPCYGTRWRASRQ
ncbi:hypothetical protein DFH08DRAFT_978644 [Mycena albidolilacea]|uniref:Uncharacterized protein n=1 Tax=Mycena albidolilacea TaxID=1033008 RepID=A0AAD6YZ79_9AGAR|nr:hypothetical protein DFH08DRAFT_978644 [Mycena albidolilacea]